MIAPIARMRVIEPVRQPLEKFKEYVWKNRFATADPLNLSFRLCRRASSNAAASSSVPSSLDVEFPLGVVAQRLR